MLRSVGRALTSQQGYPQPRWISGGTPLAKTLGENYSRRRKFMPIAGPLRGRACPCVAKERQ
jgi:CO/xanthine dehydrogenase FAD-binding subunit